MNSETQNGSSSQPLSLPSPAYPRFEVASCMDPLNYISKFRGRNPIPRLKNFDLFREIGHIPKIKPDDKPREVKMKMESWLKFEFDRALKGTGYTEEEAFIAAVTAGTNHFMAYGGFYDLWDRLKEALIGETWAEDDDFTEMNLCRSDFKFDIIKIPGGAEVKRRSFRFPPVSKDSKGKGSQIFAVMSSIGMDKSQEAFLQVMAADGMRSLPSTMYGEKMDKMVEDFYYLFARRFRNLVAKVKYVWAMNPNAETQRVMQEIEEWGGL